ncbi:hypothetical protein J1N35_041161 [Gossypium stocksii]|uniref:DUF4219 domain-containing protein n=1 Tax=Gossypium stocksii TaxID=47602 RepID=A0A9D3ZJ48_9ROSI|nr:hypothetical protein J1N35_041161 [Gossypium stocksii]
MTSTSGSNFHEESQSISKPPYFNGANYSYWKTRVMFFIQANNLAACNIIMDGPSISQKQDKYNRLSSCSNAKEIWHKIEVSHEGQEEAYFFLMAIEDSKNRKYIHGAFRFLA